MELKTRLSPEAIASTLMDCLFDVSQLRDQLHEIIQQTIDDTGLSVTPIEQTVGGRPAYADTIKGLIGQNDKQREWLEDRQKTITDLDTRLSFANSQISYLESQLKAFVRLRKTFYDDFKIGLSKIKAANNKRDLFEMIGHSIEKTVAELEAKLKSFKPAELEKTSL